MALIETRLHEHFASLEDDDAESTAAPTNIDISMPRDSVPETLDQPFAKVNTVVDNSPAAAAGLKPGDLIRNFGYVNAENHDGLKKVAECVQGNEGVTRQSLPHVRRVNKADRAEAKHPRQGLTKQWRVQATGTPLDADTATRLGRQRDAWVPYPAAVSRVVVSLSGWAAAPWATIGDLRLSPLQPKQRFFGLHYPQIGPPGPACRVGWRCLATGGDMAAAKTWQQSTEQSSRALAQGTWLVREVNKVRKSKLQP
jgi:hypothetical protein